jgi:hypothetical protein
MTSDGKLFEKEDDAKSYEFEKALRAWAAEQGTKGCSDAAKPPEWSEPYLDAIMRDRIKLLGIFKLLNGGPGVPSLSRSFGLES